MQKEQIFYIEAQLMALTHKFLAINVEKKDILLLY